MLQPVSQNFSPVLPLKHPQSWSNAELFSSFQGRSSIFHFLVECPSSLLRAIDRVGCTSVASCPQGVSQASQHSISSETQATGGDTSSPQPPSTSPFSPNPSPRQSVYITACLDTVFVTNEERATCIDRNQFRPCTCVPPIRAVGTLIPSDNRAVTPHLALPLGSP